MYFDKKQLLLYAVTDRRWATKESFLQQVEKALKGGVTLLQLREKNLEEEKFLEEAKKIRELCHAYDVPLIINDNRNVFQKSNADGIHIGQTDGNAAEIRRLIGERKILGVTAQTVEQAKKAEADGADYLGVGSVFTTGTKTDAIPITFDKLREIVKTVSIPVVAIGGITQENVSLLKGTGIAGISVVSAIFAQEDILQKTRELKEICMRLSDDERHYL